MTTAWPPPPDRVDRALARLPRRVRAEMRLLDLLFAEHAWERALAVRLRALRGR